MKRIDPTTIPPVPAPRMCPMCDGEAVYRGIFGGDREGYGCTSRGCGHYFLTRREAG